MDNAHPEKVDPALLTHICDSCGKTFSSSESLSLHQMKHKSKEEIEKRKRIKTKEVKEDGKEGAEGEEESVCCPICGRQFASKKSYLKVSDWI